MNKISKTNIMKKEEGLPLYIKPLKDIRTNGNIHGYFKAL